MKNRSSTYDGFTKENGSYFAVGKVGNKQARIEPGIYRLDFDRRREEAFLFETEFTHDAILDLPNPEYQSVMRMMSAFLKPEKRALYQKLGYLYKRNILFHGKPGAGKTILVNRISTAAVKEAGAICVFVDAETAMGKVDGLALLEIMTNWFRDTNPDSLLVLILEEVDEMISRREHQLLVFLDGQNQRPNTIVFGTTNHPEDIPARFLRPGRFSQPVEIKFPTLEARIHYMKAKLGEDFKELLSWAEKTDGFSIDELKEVIQASFILEENIDVVVNRIKRVNQFANGTAGAVLTGLESSEASSEDGEDYDYEEDEKAEEVARAVAESQRSFNLPSGRQ